MADVYGETVLRRVRWHIAYYWDIRKAVTNRRLEMKSRRGAPELTSNGHYSDPTQTEARIDLEPIRQVQVSTHTVKRPEEWIAAIDKVMRHLDYSDALLIRMSFWKSRNWRYIIDELHMDKTTYYRRRDRLVVLFAIEAARRGLIYLPDYPGERCDE